MTRTSRSKEDLKRELREQLQLLAHACAAFDTGLEPIGKHIAISLRVLLHHHNRSRALLEQLGLRGSFFVDSAGPLSKTNLLAECNLVGAAAVADGTFRGATYVSLAQMGGGPYPPRRTPFTEWWTGPVMKDAAGVRFSRLQLVTNVADTDGGGHVDPTLDQEYAEMSRVHGLGWNFVSGPYDPGEFVRLPMQGRLELVCMRQIAWEVIETLRLRAPEAFPS